MNEVESEEKLSLQSSLGNHLYNFLHTYEDVAEAPASLDIDVLKDLNEKLSVAGKHAVKIDELVNENLLVPINDNVLHILSDIEKNYHENSEFSPKDKENYKAVLAETNNIIDQIYDVYYILNSEATAKLEIDDFTELIKINKRLDSIERK